MHNQEIIEATQTNRAGQAIMSISFSCPQCQKMLRVKSELAGKLAACPGCKTKVRIPTASTPVIAKTAPPPPEPSDIEPNWDELRAFNKKTSVKAARQELEQFIVDALAEPIVPVRRTLSYRLGVVLVALAIFALPLFYVGLVVLLGWAVYWHTTQNTGIIGMGYGRGRALSLFVYVAPIIAGVTAVLFMLKPLFARSSERGGEVSLSREGQPALFLMVDSICEAVHAPKPKQIDINFSINASAHFGAGLLSFLRGDLVLTLGLPLMAGLTLQQLAGVLAHEFGHFSQGAGMRVSMMVRMINMWFARVAYERDEWDDWLVGMSEELDFRIGWVFYLTRFAVYLIRCVLWCFMIVSHGLSCWFSRQMEFDADLHEIRLAGSKTFESTCRRLMVLNVGLADFLRDPPPPETLKNPVRAVITHCDAIEGDIKRHVKKYIAKTKTHWFDTHPADSERIAHAQQHNEPGTFHNTEPADKIVRNFDSLCVKLFRL